MTYLWPRAVKIRQSLQAATGASIRTPVVAAKLRIPPSDSGGLVRLDLLMKQLWGRRLGLVVAPAGSGKTTLLSRFATAAGVPVAWYRCESWDVSGHQLLRHLAEAFAPILGEARDWPTTEKLHWGLGHCWPRP